MGSRLSFDSILFRRLLICNLYLSDDLSHLFLYLPTLFNTPIKTISFNLKNKFSSRISSNKRNIKRIVLNFYWWGNLLLSVLFETSIIVRYYLCYLKREQWHIWQSTDNQPSKSILNKQTLKLLIGNIINLDLNNTEEEVHIIFHILNAFSKKVQRSTLNI